MSDRSIKPVIHLEMLTTQQCKLKMSIANRAVSTVFLPRINLLALPKVLETAQVFQQKRQLLLAYHKAT
jgi:hypothetical protein